MRTVGYILALVGLTIASLLIVFIVNAPQWLERPVPPATPAATTPSR